MPPAPTFLGSDPLTREGKVFFSWADRAPAEILRPRPTPSRVSCQSIAASIGPQQVLVEISLFRQSLFCGSFARRLGFRWAVRNNGSGIGFRLYLTLLPRSPCHSLPLVPSFRTSVASARQRPKAFPVSGRPLLATSPFRQVEKGIGYVDVPSKGIGVQMRRKLHDAVCPAHP